ncbi:DMT family transporter [Morganella morganii]|nr:EamA/RhaT family transporter [Morganella morganii]MBT0305493.1 DMT family transporter [Morganella morganii subsp. morganii]AVD58971.1 EamA/RhaT family transporter [Morganella morganii]EGT3610174.1 DMT family transporter [Morganella morganii]EHZ6676365.1 DMT family transporter [Morganella morganii]
MTEKKVLLCMALVIALIWGSNFPVSKSAIEHIGAWLFRFYCNVISVVILLIVVLFLFRKEIVFKDVLLCIPLGVFNLFLVPLLNNIALFYTDAVKASVLIYTMPAFTSLIYVVINRSINIKYVMTAFLGVTGILIFIAVDKIGTGELIILISAFFWATGTVLSEKIPVKSNLLLRVFYQNGISLLLIVLTMPFMSDDIQLPLSVISQPRVLLPVLYTGITGGVFVYILWFYMIEKGGAELTSCAILLSPVISVFISCFFLDESVTLSMLAGMLFIISGLFIAFRKEKSSGR